MVFTICGEKRVFIEQATDVLRRRSKLKESDISEEAYIKLKNSESRLAELKSSMKTLGKEATKAMLEVDDQQQNITYQRLRALVIHSNHNILAHDYLLVPGLDMK